jgi:acyl carrier protein
LYLGGEGLARGYLSRPDLTAERFIPDPFSKEQGARLYKTGDLVKYLPDGQMEYLGRIDHQVKIRGFRIELGEIEAVLSSHQAVRESVVIVREDVSGDKRLVAYVVSGDEAPAVSELREHLQRKLPEHMIPSAVVFLEEIPLTPNGKIDRRGLPEPEQGRSQVEAEYVGPRTEAEEMMAEIWAEVLGVERVGVFDNFFELGGHSLLATQVISRVRDVFELEVPLRKMFEEPTVSGMGEAVEEEIRGMGEMLEELKGMTEEEVRALLEAEADE